MLKRILLRSGVSAISRSSFDGLKASDMTSAFPPAAA
jgi:hypothetical protein